MAAINTMIGIMVNPDASQELRRGSSNDAMDVKEALSIFSGEERTSSINEFGDELPYQDQLDETSRINGFRRCSALIRRRINSSHFYEENIYRRSSSQSMNMRRKEIQDTVWNEMNIPEISITAPVEGGFEWNTKKK